jgi:hypothetical protein
LNPDSENASRELGRGPALGIAFIGGVGLLLFLRAHLLWRLPSYPILGPCFAICAAGVGAGGLYWLTRRYARRALGHLWRLASLCWSASARLVARSGGVPRERSPQRSAILGLIGAGFAAHFFLVLNDGTYFDGWLVRYVWATGEHHILYDFFSRVGIPFLSATHFPQLQLPSFPFGYQLTSFVFLIADAILAYLVLLRIGVFSQGTAFMVALLALTSPLFYSAFEVTTNQYTFFRLVFMLSLFLILGPWPERAWARGGRAVLVSVLLWVSFNLNSLLVVFYPLLALVSLARHGREAIGLRFWLSPWRLWLLGQPVLHWIGKRYVHPPHGDNIANNEVTSLTRGLTGQLWTSPLSVLEGTLAPLRWLANARPLVLGVLVVGALLVAWRRSSKVNPQAPSREAADWWLVVSGVLLILAGVFPYLTVGRHFPFVRAGSAHYNLLLVVPCAMILTGFVRGVCGRRFRAFGAALLVVLAASSAIWLSASYLRWQVRGIRAEAIVQGVRELPTSDYPVLGSTSTVAFGDARDQVNGYTLTFLLASAQGEFRSIVIPDGPLDRSKPEDVEAFVDLWRLRPYLAGLERGGPQGQLVLEQGPGFRDDTASVFEYYRIKFLDPDALRSYLSGWVSVKLVPGPRAPAERRSE